MRAWLAGLDGKDTKDARAIACEAPSTPVHGCTLAWRWQRGAHAPAAHPTPPPKGCVQDPPAHLFVNSSAAGAASAGELASREAAAASAMALTAAAPAPCCWGSCACTAMNGVLRDACTVFINID